MFEGTDEQVLEVSGDLRCVVSCLTSSVMIVSLSSRIGNNEWNGLFLTYLEYKNY